MPIDDQVYQSLLEIFKTELKEGHQALVYALLQLETADAQNLQTHLQNLFRTTHNVKGAAKSVSLDAIATLAHQLEDQFSQWRETHYKPNKTEITDCLLSVDHLLTLFESSIKKNQKNIEILKIPLFKVERANAKADEFITYKLRFENWKLKLNHVRKLLKQSKQESHFTEIHNKLLQLSEDSNQFVSEFSRALQDLQYELREMRLLPIETLLTPLKRTLRELADTMQKNVVLELSGGDIEMDKTILDLIKDPLNHLLRNAIDHGIETQEERKKTNKLAQATIHISVVQIPGKIKIIFSDDGRGIDTEKLRKKAYAEKRFSEEKLLQLSNQDILELILLPGFSTSQAVTEISGRGVGLDVVLTNIEKAKGKLTIKSELNKGTTFTLELPLTLAKVRGLFVKIANAYFMLPSLSLDSLHTISRTALKFVESELVYHIRDDIIPVRFLADLLQIKTKVKEQQNYFGILLGDRLSQFMILVDDIENEYDCVIKPLPKPFNKLNLYIGMTLTGTNELVPILNPKFLCELAKNQLVFISSVPEKKNMTLLQKHILVVDDSLTARSLIANALRSAGFEVTTKNDGCAALNVLQKKHFDCIVTDIEMPHMDGFKLTQSIKSHADYKKIPLIIVSNHESDEEKKRGIDSGANAYLAKSQFDTRALIKMIESLL